MKREERTLLNQLRKSVTTSTINVEIPVSYTHEGRQAIHELLTIEKGLYAPCIYWNDILGEYCVHYERTMGDPTATATKREQETRDIDEVTAELPRRDYTWTGYHKPTETAIVNHSKKDVKTLKIRMKVVCEQMDVITDFFDTIIKDSPELREYQRIADYLQGSLIEIQERLELI